jgi:cAMP-dependent protein kinase regulator
VSPEVTYKPRSRGPADVAPLALDSELPTGYPNAAYTPPAYGDDSYSVSYGNETARSDELSNVVDAETALNASAKKARPEREGLDESDLQALQALMAEEGSTDDDDLDDNNLADLAALESLEAAKTDWGKGTSADGTSYSVAYGDDDALQAELAQLDALEAAEDKISEYAAMLQKVPLLQSLKDDERHKIANRLNAIEFEDGDAIVTAGESGDAMYILQTGEAQAFVQGDLVMEYGAGEFFGELALRSKQTRAATVKASGFSTTVLQLPQEDFNWLMTQKGDIKALIEQQADNYKFAEYATMLQKVPLLQSLTDDERQKVAGCLNAIEFEDGDAIITEGEAGDAMYILQSGEAQAFVQGTNVMEYESGSFFGELAMRSSQPRAATVKASGFSTTVLQLPQKDFNWLMSKKGDIKALIEQQANAYAKVGDDTPKEEDDALQAELAQLDALEVAEDKISEYAAMLQKVPLMQVR